MKYFFTKMSISHLNETFNQLLIKNYLASEDFQMRKLISKPKTFENNTLMKSDSAETTNKCYSGLSIRTLSIYILKLLAFGIERKILTDFLKM